MNITPSNILRLYIWNLLSQNGALKSSDYPDGNGGTLIPVIPVEDEPQFADLGKPYLIYGFAEQYTNGLRQVRRGTFVLRIIARTYSELGEITTMISRAFEGGDTSAANVNLWSSAFTLNGSKPFNNVIRFTTCDATYVSGGDAPESEGGTIEGELNITYDYVSHQTVKVYQPNGTWA